MSSLAHSLLKQHFVNMFAGFGWSLSDVVLLTRYVGTIHRALNEEGGSASQSSM